MRDRSLGAVPPLRACEKILLHFLAFFGSCVCWITISAHSITELPAPMSLSPFPVDLRTLDIEEQQMDCQSGCPLKGVNFAYYPGANLDSGCPAQGSASMWALMEGPHATEIRYPMP